MQSLQSPKSLPNDTHSTLVSRSQTPESLATRDYSTLRYQNDTWYLFLPLLHHPQPNKILFARSLSNTQTRAVRKHKFIVWCTYAEHCTDRESSSGLIMQGLTEFMSHSQTTTVSPLWSGNETEVKSCQFCARRLRSYVRPIHPDT